METPMEEKPAPEQMPQHTPPAKQEKKSSRKLLIIIICFLVFVVGIGIGVGVVLLVKNGDSNDTKTVTCTYNNTEYKDGDTFEATDGCNTCNCENGSVACTEIACVDDPQETTMKDVTFSLEGDKDALLPFSLDFEASVPENANIDDSANSVGVTSQFPEVTIEGQDYELKIYLIYEAQNAPFTEATMVFTHPQFGNTYRVITEGMARYEYATGVTETGTCVSIADDLNAPCGTSVINLEEAVFFLADCYADEENALMCDKIMESLEVTKKVL